MNTYNRLFIFIIGTILGSFYNVIGDRIPKQESIIYPSSHCPNCNHKLKFYELIPIISFIIQKGKCRNCHKKISLNYPLSELITGIIFTISYEIYGLNPEFIIALTLISMLIIITISDYNYMIIPDSILIFFEILLLIEISLIYGINQTFISLLNGILSFIFMYLLKKIGDFIFKKESMGGGDIKLLFVIGTVLSFPVAAFSIFIGSFIGLPLSIFLVRKEENHIIPFGPFISLGTIISLLCKINLNTIIQFYNI